VNFRRDKGGSAKIADLLVPPNSGLELLWIVQATTHRDLTRNPVVFVSINLSWEHACNQTHPYIFGRHLPPTCILGGFTILN
jgi:hypothetical protein